MDREGGSAVEFAQSLSTALFSVHGGVGRESHPALLQLKLGG